MYCNCIGHPFCAAELCSKVAVVADHIVPARLVVQAFRDARICPFDAGFYLMDNTMGLCHSHHNSKTATEMEMDWTRQIEVLINKYTPRKTG